MSSSSTALASAVLAVALAGGGAAYWYYASAETSPPPAGTPAAPDTPPTGEGTAPRPDAAPLDPPKAEPAVRPDDTLLLPDGTRVPALNGVKSPPKLVWQKDDYSPIVGVEHSNGYDWYRHADGSYSTTLMLWRDDLGRAEPVSYCLHPLEAAPVEPKAPDGALPTGAGPGRDR